MPSRFSARGLLLVRPVTVAALALAVCLTFTGCGYLWKRPVEPVPQGPSPENSERFAQAESRLASADPTVRQQAAVALLSMDHPAALQALQEILHGTDDPAAKISIIRAAAFYADPRLFDGVMQAIGDPYPDVRAAAAEALARYTRADQVQAMIDLIGRAGTTSQQKQLMFAALGAGLSVKATPVLLEGLDSGDEDVRAAAWEALKTISGRQLPLNRAEWEQWWETNQHRTREEILDEHLRAMSSLLAERSREVRDLQEQHEELMALAGSPDAEAPRKLLDALSSRHLAVRQFASFRLSSMDAEALAGVRLEDRDTYEILRAALEDESPQVRRNVIRFAVRAQGARRDDLIRKALTDTDPQALVAAIESVEATTGPGAVVRLQDLTVNSPYDEVREAAANALGKVGTTESVPALIAALADEAEDVRWFAVEGLRKLGATQAVPVISQKLERDPSPRVRAIAASALGELGQPAAVPSLRLALGDRAERVREKAVAALLALAADNYERMKVIADAFRRESLYNPAEQVLQRIIDTYSDEPDMREEVAAAHRDLADVMKDDGDLAGAARVYGRLDDYLGGSIDARRKMVDSWLSAGQDSSLVAALKMWLTDGGNVEHIPLLELAVDAAERLLADDKREQARAVLSSVRAAQTEQISSRLEARIARLVRELGMDES